MLGSNAPGPLAAAILTTFILVSFFGVSYGMGMQTDSHGKMTGCIFTGPALCTMTPFEHIAEWQITFSFIPTEAIVVPLMLLMLTAVCAIFAIARRLRDLNPDVIETRHRLYAKRAPALAYVNPLQEAFSQGILNPKLH